MKHPTGQDSNNPFAGYIMPPGLYIHCSIAESEYLNWTEKVLLGLVQLGETDNTWLAKYMGFKNQTIRNMKHQISKKLKAHKRRK